MGAVLCGEWIQQVPAESQPTDRHSVAGDNVASQQLNSGGFWSGLGGSLLNHLPPSLALPLHEAAILFALSQTFHRMETWRLWRGVIRLTSSSLAVFQSYIFKHAHRFEASSASEKKKKKKEMPKAAS